MLNQCISTPVALIAKVLDVKRVRRAECTLKLLLSVFWDYD
jgi:hypothetical protein